MSDQTFARPVAARIEGTDGLDGRRRQLRTLLLTAADTARRTRRVRQLTTSIGRPVARAVRDRVSMLLSAAG